MSYPWVSSLVLNNGEWIVRSWKGNEQTKTRAVVQDQRGRAYAKDVKNYQNGVLVLTNHRIMWLEKHGTLSKSYEAASEIALEELRGLSMGGTVFKHVTITDNNGPHVFHLEVGEKEFPVFRQMIEYQMNQRKQAIDMQKRQERVHVMIDFSALQPYIEKGMVPQVVKCANCGAPLRLPQSGSSVTCEHCHAQNLVQDVFEKVRSLIS